MKTLKRSAAVRGGLANEKNDNTRLLGLLADIRMAVGDPEGRLMQDELVQHCAELATSERWHWIRVELLSGVLMHLPEPAKTLVGDILANGSLLPDPKGKRYGFVTTGKEHQRYESRRQRCRRSR